MVGGCVMPALVGIAAVFVAAALPIVALALWLARRAGMFS